MNFSNLDAKWTITFVVQVAVGCAALFSGASSDLGYLLLGSAFGQVALTSPVAK